MLGCTYIVLTTSIAHSQRFGFRKEISSLDFSAISEACSAVEYSILAFEGLDYSTLILANPKNLLPSYPLRRFIDPFH